MNVATVPSSDTFDTSASSAPSPERRVVWQNAPVDAAKTQYQTHAVDPLSPVSADDPVVAIITSQLQPAGRFVALRLTQRLLDETLVPVETCVVPTDDGGLTIEFTSRAGRELTIVVPDDGSIRYFVARARDGFRRVGAIVDLTATGGLARWLAGRLSDIPEHGLELSRRR